MMRIRQTEKTLHIYFDHLNQALNVVLLKIEMTHKNENVIDALSNKVQLKAVRTFKAGLRSAATKKCTLLEILHQPNGSIWDSSHNAARLSLLSVGICSKNGMQYPQGMQRQYQQQRLLNQEPPPEPMDVDSSGRFRRQTFHQPQRNQQMQQQQQPQPHNPFRQAIQSFGQQFKRTRDEASNAYQRKAQRINQIGDQEDNKSLYNEVSSSVSYTNKRVAPNGRYVYILIDSGATSSYISKIYPFADRIKLEKPIKFNTLHGTSTVTHKREINLVGFDLELFETEDLKEFDIILGEDSLRKMKARIDLFDYSATFEKEEINENKTEERINYTIGDKTYENDIKNLMKNNYNNEILPFTTMIQAEDYIDLLNTHIFVN